MPTFGRSRILQDMLAEYEWELPTSFIDIVFLLLLYYTLTMKFHTMEQRLDAWLPRDKGPSVATVVQKPLDELVINVTAVSAQDLNTPVFSILEWNSSNPTQLAERLAQMKTAADTPVVINGKPDCPFKHIMAALDACTRAKLFKVEFRAPPALDGGGSDSDHSRL